MVHRRERVIILAALFTALSVALGFLLAGIPNFELMTLTVFMGGLFCGACLGGAIGAIAIALHSLLNPLGPAPPPLLVAQVVAFGVIGAAGGLVGPRVASGKRWGFAASAAAGLVLTLVYDVLTTLATAFIAAGSAGFDEAIGGIFLAGAIFIAWHAGINTIVFAIAVAPLVRAVRAWEGGRTS